jgi:hypothetical protein
VFINNTNLILLYYTYSYPCTSLDWSRGSQAPRSFRHSAHEGGKVVSLTYRSLLTPREGPWYSLRVEVGITHASTYLCKLRAVVGLLTGHTSLRAHLYKLGYTQGQECRLCGYEKKDRVHIVCVCPVLAGKRYRILGCVFLNVRVNSLLILVANTGLAWALNLMDLRGDTMEQQLSKCR